MFGSFSVALELLVLLAVLPSAVITGVNPTGANILLLWSSICLVFFPLVFLDSTYPRLTSDLWHCTPSDTGVPPYLAFSHLPKSSVLVHASSLKWLHSSAVCKRGAGRRAECPVVLFCTEVDTVEHTWSLCPQDLSSLLPGSWWGKAAPTVCK